ncbi:MAG: hypothetical protein CM15mV59_1520 [Caudoviricetes sp.]|nr:MAG: hypothetical protein CM15mV59_1520 [Caudoviricetes sp.]
MVGEAMPGLEIETLDVRLEGVGKLLPWLPE